MINTIKKLFENKNKKEVTKFDHFTLKVLDLIDNEKVLLHSYEFKDYKILQEHVGTFVNLCIDHPHDFKEDKILLANKISARLFLLTQND